MNYALMTTTQLEQEIVKINQRIIELRGKQDAPCNNREWLAMDATIGMFQDENAVIQNELDVMNLF